MRRRVLLTFFIIVSSVVQVQTRNRIFTYGKLHRSSYCINTNEIPGELSRENLISSHVKVHVIFTCENITFAMAT